MSKNEPKRNVPSRPASPTGDGPDLARKFMRDVPAGSMTDAPEPRTTPGGADLAPDAATPRTLFEQDHPVAEAPVEVVAAPAASADGVPVAEGGETAPEIVAEPTVEGAEPPVAAPQAEVKPAEAAAVPAEQPAAAAPAAPSYAPDEAINLVPGSEPWTREQIVTRLQQSFTELEPKAKEAEQFRALLGGEYAEAESRWKPTLERLAANPQRTAFLEQVLAIEDPAMLDYLQRSAEFYRTEVPAASAMPQPTAAPAGTPSPEITAVRGQLKAMEENLMTYRFRDEQANLFTKYPFLRQDEKSRQSLFNAAAQLFAADAAANKPALERRGLLQAEEGLRVFLEAKQALYEAQNRPSQQPLEPRPGVGPQALLPGTGPGAVGTTRPAPPREYSGPPENAKAQFMQDFPE